MVSLMFYRVMYSSCLVAYQQLTKETETTLHKNRLIGSYNSTECTSESVAAVSYTHLDVYKRQSVSMKNRPLMLRKK